MQQPLWEPATVPDRIDLAPGVVWLRRFLSSDEQGRLAVDAMAFIDGPAGAYVPTVRGGGKMHVRMLCFGRHWNALTYRYGPARDDHDHQPAPAIPPGWGDLARRAAHAADFAIAPDVCIANLYGADGRMGLHQDKDERPETIAAGIPVVSFSIGDTARFLLGGLRRRDPVQAMLLESGDALVFGGPARLRYHGVSRIAPGTGPTGLRLTGRLNLTFREY